MDINETYLVEWEVEPDRFIVIKEFPSHQQATEELRERTRNNPKATYRMSRLYERRETLVTVVGKHPQGQKGPHNI